MNFNCLKYLRQEPILFMSFDFDVHISPHDFVINVVPICVMTFIKYHEVDSVQSFYFTLPQSILKNSRGAHNNLQTK